jgi:hypothetical protein
VPAHNANSPDQLSFPHFAALKYSSGTPYASMQRAPAQERAVRGSVSPLSTTDAQEINAVNTSKR